jgi:hypothetical protein
LFNGVFDYDQLLAKLQLSREANEYPYKVTLIVGAADAKYTKETLSKTRDSLERLPGGAFFNINGKRKYYPSPFSQKYLGG